VRVLLVSALDAGTSDLGAVAAELEAEGHRVRVLTADDLPTPAREAALAARIAKAALLFRPDVAALEVSAHLSATAAALKATRIPYLLWGSEAGLGAAPSGPREVLDAALRLACQGAAAVVVGSDAAADRLAARGEIEELELLDRGVDLDNLPLGARAEARAALRLPETGLRVLGLVGTLDARTGLELLTLAHRQLAGVALLVAGDGPHEAAVFAMSTSTRPSSPVVHVGPLGPATRVLTACAADVTLALDSEALSPESWNLAALGRRQVTFEVPGTDAVAAVYPEHRTVFAAPPHPEALREVLAAALEEEAQAGPLPEAAVEQARAQLDAATRFGRLAQRILQCA